MIVTSPRTRLTPTSRRTVVIASPPRGQSFAVDRGAQTLERRSHEMTVEQDHQQPEANHGVHVDAHRAHAAQQHDHRDAAAHQNHDGRRHPCDKARQRRGQQRQALRRRQRLRRGTQCHVREEHPAYPYDNGQEMQPAGELHAELSKGGDYRLVRRPTPTDPHSGQQSMASRATRSPVARDEVRRATWKAPSSASIADVPPPQTQPVADPDRQAEVIARKARQARRASVRIAGAAAGTARHADRAARPLSDLEDAAADGGRHLRAVRPHGRAHAHAHAVLPVPARGEPGAARCRRAHRASGSWFQQLSARAHCGRS